MQIEAFPCTTTALGHRPALAWFGVALLGLDFVVTGIRGYCPLYARLGIGRQRLP